MRAGKDYFTDKTPFTTMAQLDEALAVLAEALGLPDVPVRYRGMLLVTRARTLIASQVISMRSVGLSRASRGWATILSATSIPFTTSPNTVYWRFRCGASFTTMKNCEPAEFGSLVRAIEKSLSAEGAEGAKKELSRILDGRT